MHINDLLSVLSSHGWSTILDNEKKEEAEEKKLVFLHLSGRYSVKEILNTLCDTLPLPILAISHIAIASFLSKKTLSSKDDVIRNLLQPDGCISLTEYKSKLSDEYNT